MILKDFFENLPNQVHPSAIEGHNTSFHFDIAGDGGGQYTVVIVDGAMSVKEGLEGESKCRVSCSYDTMNGLLDKSLNPMMALFTGKLKITSQGEMLKYAKIFGLM